MVVPSGAALGRFAVLMFLSSMVAAVGLLQNSAAVVIGAMMIAPLMSPIMGVAASLVMGWGWRLWQGLVLVSVAALSAVAVGWMFATLLPATGTGLPAEVVVRCSPDIRDLLVALGAGAAGAFATVHKQISVALPGVAVAVAVVPPCGGGRPARSPSARVGSWRCTAVRDQPRRHHLDGGTDIPGQRFGAAANLRDRRRKIVASLAAAAAAAVAIALILIPRFVALTGHARDLETATSTITNMLGPGNSLGRITTSGDSVRAEIVGPTAPPSVQEVSAQLTRALGRAVTVQLGWIPVHTPQERPQEPPPPLSTLAPVVAKWLTGQSLTLEGLSFDSGTLVVSAAGPRPPQNSDQLAAQLKETFGQQLRVSLGWTRTPEDIGPTDDETALAAARTTAISWAATRLMSRSSM